MAEAQACGLPVIVSNRINIWREVANYWGGLVNDDTLEGTIASLRRWMELTPEEIAEVGRRTLKCFNEQFNLHFNSDRILHSIEGLASCDAGRPSLSGAPATYPEEEQERA